MRRRLFVLAAVVALIAATAPVSYSNQTLTYSNLLYYIQQGQFAPTTTTFTASPQLVTASAAAALVQSDGFSGMPGNRIIAYSDLAQHGATPTPVPTVAPTTAPQNATGAPATAAPTAAPTPAPTAPPTTPPTAAPTATPTPRRTPTPVATIACTPRTPCGQ